MVKYDWFGIRQEYIAGHADKAGKHGFSSIPELARRYGVSVNSLYLRSRVEGWKTKRKAFWAGVAEAVEKQEQERFIEQAKNFDNLCADAASAGVKQIKEHLDVAELAGEIAGESISQPPIELDRLSKGLVNFQKAGRLVYGETTEHAAIEGIEFIPVK